MSSLKYRFLWKIEYLPKLYIRNIISYYACICYFLLDVRANQCGCAWVPWSIDSFEKYSNFVYFTCIISSHLRMYLLFSLGCSGEPVSDHSWVPWSIDSFEKYSSFIILYIRNIISCNACICYFLLDVRANQCPWLKNTAWVPWIYRMFVRTGSWVPCSKIQYLRVLYLHNIISSTHVSAIFFWMFGRTSPAIREFPEV